MKLRKLMVLATLSLMVVVAGCGKKNTTNNDKKNEGSEENKESTITFSQAGGVYDKEFELSLSSEGGEIYYTLDGHDPRDYDNAIKYDSAIKIKDRKGDSNVVAAVDTTLFCTSMCSYSKTNGLKCNIKAPSDDAVDKCTIVRAAVKYSDGTYSDAVAQTYFIGTMDEHIQGLKESCEASGGSLAVVSLSINFEDLFDYDTGIYVKGAVFDKEFEKFKNENSWFQADDTRKVEANYTQRGKEWERPVHLEFYEVGADKCELVLNQDCGIRVQGNYSRSDLQKGFRLYAKSKYGEKKFKYPIFGDESIVKYDSFVLRAGGNCAFTAKYNDAYWHRIAEGVDASVETKDSRACVLYINGEYFGLYVLEEDYSADYFETHYGVNKEDVVVYKGDAEKYQWGYKLDEGTVPDGETEHYFFNDLKKFIKTHRADGLSDDREYNKLLELVDEESLLDYFSMEVWLNNKWDWPGKNWSMWKTATVSEDNEYADGKWRFMLYDVEFGGVSGGGDATTNTVREDNYKTNGLLNYKETDNIPVQCFALAMTNESFRNKFYARLDDISKYVDENGEAIIEKYEKTFGPLFDQFFARYEGAGKTNDALYGGYASSKCIRDFIAKRSGYIPKIVDWVKGKF